MPLAAFVDPVIPRCAVHHCTGRAAAACVSLHSIATPTLKPRKRPKVSLYQGCYCVPNRAARIELLRRSLLYSRDSGPINLVVGLLLHAG